MKPIEITAVIPVYNEESMLYRMHEETTAALKGITPHYEVLYVDDGSSDNSREMLSDLCERDSRVRAILLSRNFGQQAAITAGLFEARGRSVAVLDCDLQDPPSLLSEMYQHMKDDRLDVVYGVRKTRVGGLFKRICYKVFYRALSWLSDHEIPQDAGDFCLMSRRFLDHLNRLPERRRFLRGLRAWVGFKQGRVLYDRPERESGEAKYTFTKLVALALDGVFTMSEKPIRFVMVCGLGIAFFAMLSALRIILWRLFVPTPLEGFATVSTSIWLMGSFTLVAIGILGEYIARIHSETKQRPWYVVEREISQSELSAASETPSDSQERVAS